MSKSPSPFDGLFDKVKKNTKQAANQMSLATRIAKLKVEIATQNSERDRHLKNIGVKTYAIFVSNKQADGSLVLNEISNELNLVERIDTHLKDLDDEIARLQSEFRNSDGKDVVDASDVHETSSDE